MSADSIEKIAALLPCPFCGNDQISINRIEPHTHHLRLGDFKMPDYPGSWSVECGSCEAGKMSMDSEADAIARWNRRALTSHAELERDAMPASLRDLLLRFAQQQLGTSRWSLVAWELHNLLNARANEAKPRINANGAREDCPRCHGESAFANPEGGWQLCSCTYRVDKEGKPT